MTERAQALHLLEQLESWSRQPANVLVALAPCPRCRAQPFHRCRRNGVPLAELGVSTPWGPYHQCRIDRGLDFTSCHLRFVVDGRIKYLSEVLSDLERLTEPPARVLSALRRSKLCRVLASEGALSEWPPRPTARRLAAVDSLLCSALNPRMLPMHDRAPLGSEGLAIVVSVQLRAAQGLGSDLPSGGVC